jgi:hypothetical protein
MGSKAGIMPCGRVLDQSAYLALCGAPQPGEMVLHELDSRLSQLNFAYHWRD